MKRFICFALFDFTCLGGGRPTPRLTSSDLLVTLACGLRRRAQKALPLRGRKGCAAERLCLLRRGPARTRVGARFGADHEPARRSRTSFDWNRNWPCITASEQSCELWLYTKSGTSASDPAIPSRRPTRARQSIFLLSCRERPVLALPTVPLGLSAESCRYQRRLEFSALFART